MNDFFWDQQIDWTKPIEGASGYMGYPAELVGSNPSRDPYSHMVQISFGGYTDTYMLDNHGVSASMDVMYRGIPLVRNVRAVSQE
jgi:hypothetical protein